MCKSCGKLGKRRSARAEAGSMATDAGPFTGTTRPTMEGDENVFSDDENERKFIQDISWIKRDHWIHSEMRWNAIHGVEWERKHLLGQGAFGEVYVGVRADRKLFAVKSIFIKYPFDETTRYQMKKHLNEIKMLRYLRSKYIVRFLGCGRSNGNNGCGPHLKDVAGLDLFMEFAPRGSLMDVFKACERVPFSEDPYVRQYTYDLLKALQYLQKKRVVHGDIKCGNILLTDDCVKLTDFGGSKQLNETNTRKYLVGTKNYLSPEAKRKEKAQSYPSDIFSLGCTVISMATGRPPERVAAKVKSYLLLLFTLLLPVYPLSHVSSKFMEVWLFN
jgi:serine/threonine protein kinase